MFLGLNSPKPVPSFTMFNIDTPDGTKTAEISNSLKDDGCYLGHYVQWFFWFFFTIGFSVVVEGIAMLIVQHYGIGR